MYSLKFVRLFYFVYTIFILILIETTTLTVSFIFPSVFLMWFLYLVFVSGAMSSDSLGKGLDNPNVVKHHNIPPSKNKLLIIMCIIAYFFTFLTARFYTGQTPLTIFNRIFSNTPSFYIEYQAHVREQQIRIFSITKLPYIFMNFYIKFLMIYAFMKGSDSSWKTSNTRRILFVALLSAPYVYFGIARGTNYEFFEISVLIIYSIVRSQTRSRKHEKKKYFGIILIILFMIYLYYSIVSLRGDVFTVSISNDFKFKDNSFFSMYFPFVIFILEILYSYFGFGFVYTSIFFDKLWMSSLVNFFSGLIPMGFRITQHASIQEIVRPLVDMRTRWHPDVAIFINNIGFFGLICICFLFGYIVPKLEKINNSYSKMALFLILFQLISFPVGNFVIVSSASKLTVFFVIFILIIPKQIKPKILNRQLR